jgi:mannan endo-1,4-beta-mannosidase
MHCKSTRSELNEARTNQTAFVTVKDGRLWDGDKPLLFFGSNFYRLALSDAFGGQVAQETVSGKVYYPQIEKVMENYAAEGIRVVRLWTFSCEGSRGTNVIPPILNKDFSLNPQGIRQLDFTVASAARHGIRLIFPLVNFEHEYCGMEWWVENTQNTLKAEDQANFITSCVDSSGKPKLLVKPPQSCPSDLRPAATKELFYTEPAVKSKFKDYVTRLLHRSNSYTGVSLRDDPTILAFELANEPHTSDYYECMMTGLGAKTIDACHSDMQKGAYGTYKAGTIVYQWLNEMGTFVKSQAPRHLLATGEEAYRNAHEDPKCLAKHSWIHNGSKGVDYARNATIPSIDIMSTHLYPDNWAIPVEDLDWFDHCVFKDRARLARENGKPIYLEESGFSEIPYPGKPDTYIRNRPYYLSRMFRYATEASYQGVMVWQAAPLTVGEKVAEDDAFTFPIATHTAGGKEYSPEGQAVRLQVECMNQIAQGGKKEDCVYLCPPQLHASTAGIVKNNDGSRCFALAAQGPAGGLPTGYPKCPSGQARDAKGWGWIADATLCNQFKESQEQFARQKACSCN